MSLVERVADLQYRFLDGMRSRAANDAAAEEGTAADFEGLRGARQCLIVTRKRSGEMVPTPVNFGISDDGRVYFRSEGRSAKVRRIGRDPAVLVAPCSFRGKPSGAAAAGNARVLPASESEEAEALIADNWDRPTAVLERGMERLPLDLVYVEVTPEGKG